MTWLRGLIGARWFLPALILVPSVVAAVLGWGSMKYTAGYSAAKAAAKIEKAEALAEQRERLLAQAERHRIAALEGQRRRFETANRIRDVRRPDCVLPAECLQYHDDIIRAAAGGAGTDGAVHGSGAGGGRGLD